MGGYLIIPWHALFLSTPLSSARLVCEHMSNFTYLYMLTKPLATFQAAWSRSFTSKLFASFAVRVEYRDIPMCEHYVPVYKLWYTNHTNQDNSQSAGDLISSSISDISESPILLPVAFNRLLLPPRQQSAINAFGSSNHQSAKGSDFQWVSLQWFATRMGTSTKSNIKSLVRNSFPPELHIVHPTHPSRFCPKNAFVVVGLFAWFFGRLDCFDLPSFHCFPPF